MGRAPTNNKQKLIETALDLIWQSSYGSVSVDDICQTADVKKGSFYHYFKSKAELAIAALDAHWEAEKIKLDAVYSPSIPSLKRFENVAKHILEKSERMQEKYGHVVGCPFTSLGSEIAGHEDLIRAKSNEIGMAYENYVLTALRDAAAEGHFREGSDLEAKANKIYTYIMGQIMMSRIQNDLTTLERDLRDGIFSILNVQQKAAA